ncbi:uncharacterized protein LY89DRAFT_212254 [Mollisia scopiformis]|uniref:Uncharacterized protein n=1 Tax=Mollisia scopiformis TaxID=149040 RepID=A0A194WXG7_MOLSC|nr:uncharacterized protein LY89DRAFT_212254 [Mollisia scopiformis]KUJ12676.1 hypothetical protein LY89DRAFT_212254 [Mollisia scopiformis]
MLSLRHALTFFLALGTTVAQILTLTASLPDSTLDGQPVNADGEAFSLGGSPASYCPTEVGTACPNVTATVFAGMSALWVEVPGGQEVYVQTDGALGFTQAHSASVPPGAYIGGFSNVTVASDCHAPWDVITWNAPDGSTGGILACPEVPAGTNGTAIYQVYAKTPAFNKTNCVTLAGLLPTYLPAGSPFGAWQYI